MQNFSDLVQSEQFLIPG